MVICNYKLKIDQKHISVVYQHITKDNLDTQSAHCVVLMTLGLFKLFPQ